MVEAVINHEGEEYIRRSLVGVGISERYWEGRWRDEKAKNERLREALERVCECTYGLEESGPWNAYRQARMGLGLPVEDEPDPFSSPDTESKE